MNARTRFEKEANGNSEMGNSTSVMDGIEIMK